MVRSQVPADVKATWPPPNFDNPETRGPLLRILSVFFTVVVFIVIGLRIYIRAYQLRNFQLDDWLITLCLFSAILLNVTAYISTDYGWDKHFWDQREEWMVPSERISWILQIAYIFNMYLAKASILLSYTRFIFGPRLRIFIWIMTGVVSAWFLGCLWATVFSCYPPKLYWESLVSIPQCSNETPRFEACVLVNIVTDFIAVLIPLPTIWGLTIAMREKAILFVLMTIGIVASCASIVRTIVMNHANSDTWDQTWYGYYVWVWTVVECGLAILCSCVPALRPMLKKIAQGLHLTESSRSNRDSRRAGLYAFPEQNLSLQKLQPTPPA